MLSLISIAALATSGTVDRCACTFPRSTQQRANQIHLHAATSVDETGNDDELTLLDGVEPGCLLVAPKHEYDHFRMKSVVLLYAFDQEAGATGVILDKATAYTVRESGLPLPKCWNPNHTS